MTTQSVQERLQKTLENGGQAANDIQDIDPLSLARKLQRRWHKSPYRHLRVEKRQIRLIRLHKLHHSDSGSTPIRCDIKIVSLDSNIKFEALSYCWGSIANPKYIDVGGTAELVMNNLHSALTALREKRACQGWLWIDALCINQNDIAERNAQIPLMKTIFSQADTVHIWLGPRTPGLLFACNRLSDIYHGRHRRAGRRIIDDDSSEFFDALHELTQCAWWRRLWVVQEATLAQEAIAHVGDITIPFLELKKALSDMHVMSVSDAGPVLDANLIAYRHVWKEIRETYKIFEEVTGATKTSLIDDDVVDLVGSLNFCNATDPRDCVYGLLGLMPPNCASRIKPDYAAPLDKIFRDFTITIIQYTRSLGILRLCGRPSFAPDLPSWVPDYSALKHRGYWSHAAARATMHMLEQVSTNDLNVNAFLADEIIAVSQCSPDIRLYEMLDGDESSRLRILVQSWRTDQPKSYCDLLRGGFRQGHVSTRPHIPEKPFSVSQVDPPGLEAKFESWHLEVFQALQEGVTEDPRLLSLNTVQGEGVFVTKQGRIGIAYASPQKGDKVAILSGFSYAMVLRPSRDRSDSCFEIISPVYCDGAMQGEAMRAEAQRRFGDERKLSDIFQEIVLI